MIYSIYYALKTLEADFWGSEMVYIVYMYIFVTCFAGMCGSVAVGSSYFFIQTVYKRIDQKVN